MYTQNKNKIRRLPLPRLQLAFFGEGLYDFHIYPPSAFSPSAGQHLPSVSPENHRYQNGVSEPGLWWGTRPVLWAVPAESLWGGCEICAAGPGRDVDLSPSPGPCVWRNSLPFLLTDCVLSCKVLEEMKSVYRASRKVVFSGFTTVLVQIGVAGPRYSTVEDGPSFTFINAAYLVCEAFSLIE